MEITSVGFEPKDSDLFTRGPIVFSVRRFSAPEPDLSQAPSPSSAESADAADPPAPPEDSQGGVHGS